VSFYPKRVRERDDLFSLSRCCFYISSFVVETRWLVLFVRTRSRFSELVQSAIIFFCGVRVACVWLCVLFARKLKKDQRPAQNHPSHTSHKKREKRLPQRAKGKGQSTTKKRERERQCVERSLLPCEEYAQQRAK